MDIRDSLVQAAYVVFTVIIVGTIVGAILIVGNFLKNKNNQGNSQAIITVTPELNIGVYIEENNGNVTVNVYN